MSLSIAKKILKIVGVLTIIGAVISIIVGASSLFGSGIAFNNIVDVQVDEDLQKGVALLFFIGLTIIILALFNVVQGILSLMASKNNKYASLAWLLSIIYLVFITGSCMILLFQDSLDGKIILGSLISIAISACTCYSANIVKKAYEDGGIV